MGLMAQEEPPGSWKSLPPPRLCGHPELPRPAMSIHVCVVHLCSCAVGQSFVVQKGSL